MFQAEPNTGHSPIRVAAALVLRAAASGRNYVLVSRRFGHAHLPDLWEFPGGKLEPGEEPAACAIRELWEETAVLAHPERLEERAIHAYEDRVVEIEFHRCAYESGVPSPEGCQAVRWVPLDALSAYRFPAASASIVARLEREGLSAREAGGVTGGH